jgi:hypothetical protein
MEALKEILSAAEFWKFVIPLLGAVLAWFLNEWRKRLWEQYVRKEDQYKQLVRCLRGFYADTGNKELRAEFLDQLNICWLYCPDDVIKKAYAFLDTVHTDQKQNDSIKENAVGEFVISVREDLLSRKLVAKTKLLSKDFRHLAAK